MAKANYYKSEVELNVGNPKEIWRTINELTYRKCTSNYSISELKVVIIPQNPQKHVRF